MQQESAPGYRLDIEAIATWTVVCALVPVLLAMTGIAFNKQVLATAPYASLIRNSTVVAFVCLPLLAVGLQWYALRRFAPYLGLSMWSGAAVVTLVAWICLPYWMFRAETAFDLALLRWRMSDAASVDVIGELLLSFATLGGLFVSLTLAASLLQTLVLRFVTQLPWKIFVIAVVAGACVELVVAHLPDLLGISRLQALNGLAWNGRLVELTLRACAGAGFGVASAFVVFKMLVPVQAGAGGCAAPNKASSFFTLATLVVLCLPVAIAIIGRDGGRAAGLSVLRSFTIAPSIDTSHGETILQHSHPIETRPGRYPVVYFSPDSKYLIVLDRELRLMLVNVATGRQLGPLGDAIALHDDYAIAWSPNSSAVVLRTKGVADPVPGTRYQQNRTVVRKYSIPARQRLGEYLSGADECYESHGQRSLIFVPDGKSLWTLCGSNTSLQPQSTMAVELDATSMRPLQRKLYGTASVSGSVRTLGVSDGTVVYLQRRYDSATDEVRLGRLSDDAAADRVYNLNESGLTGGLLAQGDVIEGGRWIADYCGTPATQRADQKSICRTLTLDSSSGELQRISDDVDRRFERNRQGLARGDGLNVEGRQSATRKKSEILVIDEKSGKVRQRIDTREQHPLTFSPDGRWLVMYSPAAREMNVYRVRR